MHRWITGHIFYACEYCSQTEGSWNLELGGEKERLSNRKLLYELGTSAVKGIYDPFGRRCSSNEFYCGFVRKNSCQGPW